MLRQRFKGWLKKYLFFFSAVILYILFFLFLGASRVNPPESQPLFVDSNIYEVISYCKFENTVVSFKVREIKALTSNIYLIKTNNLKENYFNIGDKLIISGEFKRADIANDYFYSQQIYGIFRNPKIIISEKAYGPLALISAFHYKILEEIYQNYHGQSANLLSGLLIGADITFPAETEAALKTTNTSHIIAISGFNLNLLAEFLSLLVFFVPRKKLSLIIVFVLFVFYCLVGFDNIPCLRALLMFVFRSIALLVGRRASYLNIWGMALLIILLISPVSVFSFSLKFSFLATLGLIVLDAIYSKLDIVIKNWILSSALVTFFCSIGVLPVSMYLGSTVTVKGLIANVLVVPIIPVTMVFGFVSVIFSMLNMPFSLIFVRFTDALLQLILLIINFSSQLTFD